MPPQEQMRSRKECSGTCCNFSRDLKAQCYKLNRIRFHLQKDLQQHSDRQIWLSSIRHHAVLHLVGASKSSAKYPYQHLDAHSGSSNHGLLDPWKQEPSLSPDQSGGPEVAFGSIHNQDIHAPVLSTSGDVCAVTSFISKFTAPVDLIIYPLHAFTFASKAACISRIHGH